MAIRAPRKLLLDDLPDFFGVEELSAVCDWGKAKAYEIARSKGFPALRCGRTIRISKAGFIRWAETHFVVQ
jgi:hypothetical protein